MELQKETNFATVDAKINECAIIIRLLYDIINGSDAIGTMEPMLESGVSWL